MKHTEVAAYAREVLAPSGLLTLAGQLWTAHGHPVIPELLTLLALLAFLGSFTVLVITYHLHLAAQAGLARTRRAQAGRAHARRP